MRVWHAIATAAFVWVLPAAPHAQTDDRDYLTAFLEDNLSDAGREVTITGFAGALSSRATIETLTIADAAGVWITLNGVTLDWSRSALLSGQVEINALTADEILVDRLPEPGPDALPDPEAAGFSLPELPVSVQITQLGASRIVLAPAVFGQAVEGSLDAALSLAEGEGQARLDLLRDDAGPDGRIQLTASYANASRQLVVDLDAAEAAGGLVATLLDLPGAPSAALKVTGSGPIDNFGARILLDTDGVERLSGTVALRGDASGGIGFAGDFAGSFAPLMAPDYATFFGDRATLSARGLRAASGALSLDDLAIATDALRLKGRVALDAAGQPLSFDLTGDLGLPDGKPVILPLTGQEQTSVGAARITLGFDAAKGDVWQVAAELAGLSRPEIAIAELTLTGSGTIARDPAAAGFTGSLTYAARDVKPADPGIAQALGPTVSGDIVMRTDAGENGLKVPRLTVTGQDLRLALSGRIGDLASGFQLSGTGSAGVDDLARLSLLAGRPLKGAVRIDLAGSGSPLGGTFDLAANLVGQAVAIGQPQIDSLLAAGVSSAVSVKRDETGIALRRLDLKTDGLTVNASGRLSSTNNDIKALLDFSDIGALGPGYGGAIRLDAAVTGSLRQGQVTLDGNGDGLKVGSRDIDTLLRGPSRVQARLVIADEALSLDRFDISNPQLRLSATAAPSGAGQDIALDARLTNLALILPEFPGAVAMTGTARDRGTAYQIDLSGTGPGGISARVAGSVNKDARSADLTVKGQAQAGLANVFIAPRAVSGPVQFDLRLDGPIRPASLAGRISLQGGRYSDVEQGVALTGLDATAVLSGGRMVLQSQSALAAGGKVTAEGSASLAAPYPADVAIRLEGAKLRNPELFTATMSGLLNLNGPLLGGARIGGRINLDTAEIRIPSGGLASTAAIPDIRHIDDRTAVRETRRRAGLFGAATGRTGADGSAQGPIYGLGIDVVAPSRIFIRGRGLDAELNGRLTLGGTTRDVVPSGQFSLIRGRLDILGKRLTLSEANLQLQGNFEPFVAIAASNASDGVTSTVRIDGPASDPVVSFTSSPELPQEEVLARLLFGRGLQSLSAFQAAQLANAVATLAGKGGEGIIGRLRKNFGLDDFDVTSDDTGSTVVRAGKYISENVYSEVEVGQDGKSEINLNLDIRPGLTVTGRVNAEGETGLGLFLEKDY